MALFGFKSLGTCDGIVAPSLSAITHRLRGLDAVVSPAGEVGDELLVGCRTKPMKFVTNNTTRVVGGIARVYNGSKSIAVTAYLTVRLRILMVLCIGACTKDSRYNMLK